MQQAILIFLGFVVLILVFWALVRATAPVRVCVGLGLVILSASVAYGLGRGVERFRCTSTHMYAFRHYSSALRNLASTKRDDELRSAVVRFDDAFQAAPYDWLRLQEAVLDVRMMAEEQHEDQK